MVDAYWMCCFHQLLAALEDVASEVAVGQVIHELSGEIVPRAVDHLDAMQADPKPKRLAEHVHEQQVTQDIAEIERVDVVPRRKATASPPLLPVVMELLQARVANLAGEIKRGHDALMHPRH